MNPLTAINVVANIACMGSMLHLIVRVFGNPRSPVYANKWGAYACKAAASVTFCGAVANVATLSTPTWSEVLLNIGVSLNFLWISYFMQTLNHKTPTKKPVRKSIYAKQRQEKLDSLRDKKTR